MREENLRVSDCCGAPPKGNGDCDTEDIGICSQCGDHCEYEERCDGCHESMKECICKPEHK